jgi:hypothetical protein
MELAEIFQTLWRRKLAVGLVVIFAVIVGISATYRVGLSPLKLQKRTVEFGAANAQILVDSPRSALADLSQDTVPLATRAAVYAQFMRSIAVKDAIAKVTGIPASAITTQGPFTSVGTRQNVVTPSEGRANQVVAEQDRYRLVFDVQEDLPVVTIYAQAPTAIAAQKLANGAVTGLQQYVESLQAGNQLPNQDRVLIRGLGPAEYGTVNSGATIKLMALAIIGVTLLGCIMIVILEQQRRKTSRRKKSEAAQLAAEQPLAGPPAERSSMPPVPRSTQPPPREPVGRTRER